MTGLALALAVGAALPSTGVRTLPVALLLLLTSLRRAAPWHRPRWLPLAVAVGMAHGVVDARASLRDCRWARGEGRVVVTGWVREVEGPRRLQIEVTSAPGEACPGRIRVHTSADHGVVEGGSIRVEGRWIVRLSPTMGVDPFRAGVLVGRASPAGPPRSGPSLRRRLARVRAAGVARVERLFAREGDLVAALLFARRSGLATEVRDRFADTGTAHLLAISGFHVGVFAGGVIWVARGLAAPRWAFALGTVAAWAYVAVLGFPDAATRAVVLLTLLALGRIVRRPVSGVGALGTALLVLVLVDPGVATRVGAQLSFAGALGIALWARPWADRVGRRWADRTGQPPSHRIRGLLDAVSATLAATVATLPLVAWHFERISLVALPASLGATPAVALALPTILVALALDAVHLGALAGIVATGAEGLLSATGLWVQLWSWPSWASIVVSRPDVAVMLVGGGAGWVMGLRSAGVGAVARLTLALAGVAVALWLWPVLQQVVRNGSLEVHMIDVGQGDALALRTPRGRWVLVDAGPPSGERLLSALRRRGVRSIDLHVVSHPDADHVGGSAHLLRGLRVRGVVGPGAVRGDGPWREALHVADSVGTPWRVVRAGEGVTIDGVRLGVLHPSGSPPDTPFPDPNSASVVLDVDWRGHRLLFMGDAPAWVERALALDLVPVDVLKVGHHGSLTSTSVEFLDRVRPEVALVSAGRGNRYGHPEPEVLDRLHGAGAEIWRTDTQGNVRLRLLRSGAIEVSSRR